MQQLLVKSDKLIATFPSLLPLTGVQVVVVVVLGVMIVTTIVGNILVCLSVLLVKKLRHPSNYLLVSLAISGEYSFLFSFLAFHLFFHLL